MAAYLDDRASLPQALQSDFVIMWVGVGGCGRPWRGRDVVVSSVTRRWGSLIASRSWLNRRISLRVSGISPFLLVVVIDGGDDAQEGVCEQRRGRPPVPGGQGADPVLVERGSSFAVWKPSSIRHRVPATVTSRPTSPGRCPGAVERDLAGAAVAAH
jgi:hypothetical protein